MKPKIKDGISVLYRERGPGFYEVDFLVNASSVILPFELDAAAFRCLGYFNGKFTLAEIAEKNYVSKKQVHEVLAVLRRHRLLDERKKIMAPDPRFQTQLNFFAGFETGKLSREDMQRRLESVRVLVIGLGGIGTWICQGLALAGVSRFVLVDPDIVSLSNLNRQCLYARADCDHLKVEVMANKLLGINPKAAICQSKRKIVTASDCIEAACDADLIVACADEPGVDQVNRLVTEAGFELKIPHILCGGYDGHLSFLGPTVIPGRTPCWYCYERSFDRQRKLAGYKELQITDSEIQGGNLGAISAITANYHVLEAIKVITGFAKPSMTGQTAELNFLDYSINYRKFRRSQSCQFCSRRKESSR